MSSRTAAPLLAAVLALAVAPHAARAVDSASFVFDTTTDPADLVDGPDFDVTGVNPIDDTGTLCDAVVMIMVDATGTPVDADSFCLDLTTGMGGSDGDYGSFGTGYLPVNGPITYGLFDLNAADLAALTGLGDADQGYFDYVVANARFLGQQTFAVEPPIPNDGPPFSLEPGMQCYQVKDRTTPKPPKPAPVGVSDAFATDEVAVQKLAYYCVPTGGAASGGGMCCYKAKGPKLEMRPVIATLDDFGAREIEVKAPKLICKPCTRSALPLP
jgi:hypothetical protein